MDGRQKERRQEGPVLSSDGPSENVKPVKRTVGQNKTYSELI